MTTGEYTDCAANCPTYCNNDQMSCFGGYDSQGCPLADTCMDWGYDMGDGMFCHNYCPPTCHDGDMVCPGWKDSQTGCQMEPDMCMPSTHYGYGWDPATGEFTDCMAFCPKYCNNDEMMCPGGYDSQGCPKEDTCMSHGYEMADGSFCYNYCPAACHEGEMVCPGWVGDNGCQMEPDNCMPSTWHGYGWDSAKGESVDCAAFCPVYCDWTNGEHLCHGGYDGFGCEMQGWCSTEECPSP